MSGKRLFCEGFTTDHYLVRWFIVRVMDNDRFWLVKCLGRGKFRVRVAVVVRP